ncbi:MAG: hypothetical protein ABI746_13680, partial [Dermatophilaceae bacterium]
MRRRTRLLGILVAAGLSLGPAAATHALSAGVSALPGADVAEARTAPRAAGFTVVRTTPREPVGLYAPRRNEVWVLERDGDSGIVLQHLVGGRWTTTRLAGQLPSDGYRQAIDGSAWNEVWVAAGERIWQYDGRAWKHIANPRLLSGESLPVTMVADGPGPGAYVATPHHGIFRHDGRTWTSLGHPRPQGTPRYPGEIRDTYWPLAMAVRDGRLYVSFEWFLQRAVHQLYRYDHDTWTQLAQGLGSRGTGASEVPGAWILHDGRHLSVLGAVRVSSGSSMVIGGYCAAWTSSAATSRCTTGEAVGAGTLRPDGTVVVGGVDRVDTSVAGTPTVQGRFVLRDATGRESAIPGDPGDATIAMASE